MFNNFPTGGEVKKEDNKVVMLLYGDAMKGKTYFANTFPQPLHINTDGNTQDFESDIVLSTAKKLFVKAKNSKGEEKDIELKEEWDRIEYYLEELIKNKNELSKTYKTIVLDVIDKFFEAAKARELRKINAESELDLNDFGRTISKIRASWFKIIENFIVKMKDTFNIVVISHMTTREIEREGTIYDSVFVPSINTVSLNKKDPYKNNLNAVINVCGRLHFTKGKVKEEIVEARTLTVYSSNADDSGNRFGITKPIFNPTYNKLLEAIKGEKNE